LNHANRALPGRATGFSREEISTQKMNDLLAQIRAARLSARHTGH
jgi:hypothetical protein